MAMVRRGGGDEAGRAQTGKVTTVSHQSTILDSPPKPDSTQGTASLANTPVQLRCVD